MLEELLLVQLVHSPQLFAGAADQFDALGVVVAPGEHYDDEVLALQPA
jgi:hypothetical protein